MMWSCVVVVSGGAVFFLALGGWDGWLLAAQVLDLVVGVWWSWPVLAWFRRLLAAATGPCRL
jgi:hypothetical protein